EPPFANPNRGNAMNRYLLVSCLFLFGSGWSNGQEISHQHTNAAPPPTEALERLRLKLASFRKVPMTELKYSIATVQLMPGEEGDEILIQSRSGLVQLRDAENGDLKWQTPVGMPFRFFQGAAFNSHTIYVTREARLYALNRANGKHRLYSIQK